MFIHINFSVKKPRDLPSVFRHHVLIVLLSEIDNGAKNADVANQATSLRNLIVDGVYFTSESFTLFDLNPFTAEGD